MKKTYWIGIGVVVLVVAAIAYRGRHRIKTMLMGPGATPPATTEMQATASPAASGMTTSGSVVMTKTGANGSYLADAKGMTLYTFDKDQKNVSTCSGGCAQIWPAFTAATAPTGTLPANLGTFKRADGTYQFTWKGMPLYYNSSDKQPGDTNGDGVGGLWHIVKQ